MTCVFNPAIEKLWSRHEAGSGAGWRSGCRKAMEIVAMGLCGIRGACLQDISTPSSVLGLFPGVLLTWILPSHLGQETSWMFQMWLL